MTKVALGVLMVAAVGTAIQIAPAATGYIYRSDNNGPASLIQLGAHAYQPEAYAPALPIAEPLKTIDAYAIGPVPLPYIAAKPISIEDAEDDEEDSEESNEYVGGGDLEGLDHGHAFEKGGGSDYEEEHHAAHGEKGSKGYHSKGHHAKGQAGHYGKEHKEGHYGEKEGGESEHHDEADAYGKHHESGGSYKGGDHGHKKYFSKGEDVTGYHKVFHKDEFKKDHDFYDVADNSGHFNKHGYEKAHHGSEEGGHKKGGHHGAGFDKGEFGKAGSHSEGEIDDADSGHSDEAGHDSHYEKEEEYGKKGAGGHEKEYSYDDDDDDEY
ncbi:hornerin-like [Galleria mellonella]|uniref:Hornerin-like n=1 Tax=Galleria mellonella TaxID=7137 RepID=A0ABM3MZQ7_GALME|nr:hornerin-like [Galleria mellonella]